MITYPRYLDRSQTPVVRLIGLGNAGVNLADRISMTQGLDLETIAVNSDQLSLSSSVAATKILLGPLTTRGLGAGGDPEIGLDAAKESLGDIEASVSGSDIVFLCGGLGGGTASGAAAMIAEAAKNAGALLIAILASPFSFEGRRRTAQASVALQEIRPIADAVIHFENDRMAELTAPRAGVSETFAACDEVLIGCVEAVVRLISAPGPLGVGLTDLLSVLEGGDGNCLFGTAAAVGDNRAHESLERALASPLLGRGRLLDDASSILVHISGPPTLSFAEVGAIMQEISRQAAEGAMIHLGVSTSPLPDTPLRVSLIAKCGSPSPLPVAQPPVRRTPAPRPVPPTAPDLAAAEPKPAEAPTQGFLEPEQPTEPPRQPPPAPASRPPRPVAPEPKPAAPKIKQETLQFEPVARGRFEKIEPTIVEGEDLDVPTFLRLAGKKR